MLITQSPSVVPSKSTTFSTCGISLRWLRSLASWVSSSAKTIRLSESARM